MEKIVVGVNKFRIEEDAKSDILRVDADVEKIQKEKLKALKLNRNNEDVKTALNILEKKAQTDENLMPYILNAVKKYATLGEICNILRKVFGEYEQTVIL